MFPSTWMTIILALSAVVASLTVYYLSRYYEYLHHEWSLNELEFQLFCKEHSFAYIPPTFQLTPSLLSPTLSETLYNPFRRTKSTIASTPPQSNSSRHTLRCSTTLPSLPPPNQVQNDDQEGNLADNAESESNFEANFLRQESPTLSSTLQSTGSHNPRETEPRSPSVQFYSPFHIPPQQPSEQSTMRPVAKPLIARIHHRNQHHYQYQEPVQEIRITSPRSTQEFIVNERRSRLMFTYTDLHESNRGNRVNKGASRTRRVNHVESAF